MRMTAETLRQEVERRFARRAEIQQATDRIAEKYRGIPHFSTTVKKFFPAREEREIWLARQVPTGNVEHASHTVLSNFLSEKTETSFRPTFASFTRDRFLVNGNEYKKTLIKVPFLQRGRNGRFVRVETLAKGVVEGVVFDTIVASSGERLVDIHQGFCRECFGEEVLFTEVAPFFEQILKDSWGKKEAPKNVYKRDGKKEKLVFAGSIDHEKEEGLRPPAEWYYLPYVLLFLDGTRVLSSTVDDCDEVSSWFEEVERICKEEVGFSPLIMDVPVRVETEDGFKSHLLEHPFPIRQKGWQELVKSNCTIDVFSMAESIEKQILGLV